MSYSKNLYWLAASQLFCILLVMHAAWHNIRDQKFALLLMILAFGVQMRVLNRGLKSFNEENYLHAWLFSVLTPFIIALIMYWAAWYTAHVTGENFQLVLF
jgi:lipopolysaccharide export LptBFGC system permease protein LptF